MTPSLALDVILSAKNYCQIAINMFEKYAKRFESKHLERSMKINFKH